MDKLDSIFEISSNLNFTSVATWGEAAETDGLQRIGVNIPFPNVYMTWFWALIEQGHKFSFNCLFK